MNFIINEEAFRKQYRVGDKGLTHIVQKSILLDPYNTNYGKTEKEQVSKFKCSIGEFCRLVYNKKLDVENSIDIDKIVGMVECTYEDKESLKLIIKEMFFDKNDNIQIFHPKLFNYTITTGNFNRYLAQFLYDVLLEGNKEYVDKIRKCFEYKPGNVMEILILNNLPELENIECRDKKYKNICPSVSKLFRDDLDFLLTDYELFMKEFENLINYYYFFYISQFAIKMSKMFDADRHSIEEIYFNLDWESVSKTRESYIKGWKMLDSNLKPLFSNINTLEILNINNIEDGVDYIDMNNIIESFDDNERNIFYQSLKNIKDIYIKNVSGINWSEYKKSNQYDDSLKDEMYDLFKCIDYQFMTSPKSGRYKLYRAYKTYFEDFCKIDYLKRRGSLGYTLNINQEKLLFITKLSMKNKEKIKLKDLFEEYKKRGIYFDRDSQSKIIDLFEKLNIIEKKSDSGDAQYVRSIL
ncbi:MAG: DNA phosphorothioation-dependent restriction protein DptG [Peptostreptococcaceae bacterium]